MGADSARGGKPEAEAVDVRITFDLASPVEFVGSQRDDESNPAPSRFHEVNVDNLCLLQGGVPLVLRLPFTYGYHLA
jgi:hypothetical protein